MAGEVDYRAVLADLEERRANLDAAIAGVRQLLKLAPEEGATVASAPQQKETEAAVRFDSFFGMTMPDAINKFLGMSKRPQPVGEITKALQEGGFPTTAKNLITSVGSTLTRMKLSGDVVSIQGKWGLSSWYPALRRERIETVSKANQAKSKSSVSKPVKAIKPKPTEDQIAQMKLLHAEGKPLAEIAKELGVHHLTVLNIVKRQHAQPASPKNEAED
jgi:hypothetical protein